MHIKYLPQCPVQSRHSTNVTYFIIKGRCIEKKKWKRKDVGMEERKEGRKAERKKKVA